MISHEGPCRGVVKCMVTVRGQFRFSCKILVRSSVSVRVRSQDASGSEPTAVQRSPQRAELTAQGSVPVSITIWLPRPHKSMGPWSGKSQESSRAGAAGPGKRHGELAGSMLSDRVMLLDRRYVVRSDFGIGSPRGERLGYVVSIQGRRQARSDSDLVISLEG